MNGPAGRAACRLLVLAGLATALVTLACRPAWSPDSRRLALATALPNKTLGVVILDRATRTTRLLRDFEPTNQLPIVGWTATGDAVLVIRKQDGSNTKIEVLVHPEAAEAEARRFEVRADGLAFELLALPPIAHGPYLFFSSDGLVRLDLESGEVRREDGPRGMSLAVARRGDGLCYLLLPKQKAGRATAWEIGTLDPETLERTPIVAAPDDSEWIPYALPSFSPDLQRIVLPAHRPGERVSHGLIVVRDGAIETRLPLGVGVEETRNFGIGSVGWKQDGVTIVAGICRRNGEDQVDEFALLELSFSGSFKRETPLFSIPVQKDDEAPAFLAPMALAPDRTVAAFSTGLVQGLPREHAGVYLADLTRGRPKVERIPFPDLPR